MPLTLYCNGRFSSEVETYLEKEIGRRGHRLVWAKDRSADVLVEGRSDEAARTADVLFGQPSSEDCLLSGRLRWLEVSSAGYARYDTPELKEGLARHDARFTNASTVFADPCAQHVLAMMLGLARRLPQSYQEQLGGRAWGYEERRRESTLLTGQTVLMLGYGAIARRLVQLLAPFEMKLLAVRRSRKSETGVRVIPEEGLSAAWAQADHIVNLLPDHPSTEGYVNARRLACARRSARFYNVGRGRTVDEVALVDALNGGRLDAAYLDVFATEPLPSNHPYWTARNCFVTPHTAGGRQDQEAALVRHFLDNLEAFEHGHPMLDRIV